LSRAPKIDRYYHFYRHVSRLGYGETSTWLRVLAEGRFEAVRCDFSVMISPAMYRRSVLPRLERTVARFDYTLYHLDGACQMRWLEALRGVPGLTGIQWNSEVMTEPRSRWIEALRRIRSLAFVLYTHANSVDEAEIIVAPTFGSSTEAEVAVAHIAKACGS
jgi:hypothetical protein